MNGRRAVIGLCALCALAFTAVTAQAASAAGTTGYTQGSATAVPNGETTELFPTSGETRLKSKSSGIALELKSTKIAIELGEGLAPTGVNSEVGGEMLASGSGQIAYLETTVTAPTGKGCEVAGGEVITSKLKGTTQGQGMFVKFEPVAGKVLAEFEVFGCSIAALNKIYKLEGSIKGVPSGTAIKFTHMETTEQNTLSLSGQNAGLVGSISLAGRTGGAGAYTPLELK